MSKKVLSKQSVEEIVNLIELVAKEINKDPSEISVRDLGGIVSERQLKNHGGLPLIKKAHFPNQEKNLASIVKAKASSQYLAKLETKLGKQELFQNTVIETITSLKIPKITEYKPNKKVKTSRELNLVLSDLHFGSDIHANESGSHNYGTTEEARRFAKVIQETLDYKLQHREETKLNVLLLGDLIQGDLGHDPRDGAPLTEQICRAIHLLTQGLSHLVKAFPQVVVHCNGGNHARRATRHPNRAVHAKWDNYETILAYSLKQIFSDVSNITFNIPKTPYVTYEVFGQKVFATHGDTVLNPGYIGKAINTGSLEGQINKINATLKDADEYKVWICGHIHVGSVVHLSNGSTLLSNGALCPTDEYAVSIGLLESCAGQMLFESVKDYPVGDVRYIRVSTKEDEDSNLEKIIKPYTGF